ncbi:dodecin [Calditrichota bacterium]
MGKTFKLIELVGTSTESYEDAIQNAITQASKSLKAISWYEIVQMRGAINEGRVQEYQVILKVGFKLID